MTSQNLTPNQDPSPMASTTSTLTDLGLGENEAVLYEILLQNPNSTIPLLQKKAPFSRTMLYYVLESLEEYELLETAKQGKKTTYNAAPPEKLEDFISDQEKELNRQKNALKGVVGDLRSLYNLAHNKPGVRFLEGLEGLKKIYLDTLTTPATTIFAYLAPGDIHHKLRDWLEAVYVKKRVKQKIEAKVIASNSKETEIYHQKDVKNCRQTIIVPEKDFPMDVEINIYSPNKVSFVSFKENEMIGMILASPAIHLSMKTAFNLSWQQAKHLSGVRENPTPTAPRPINEESKRPLTVFDPE